MAVLQPPIRRPPLLLADGGASAQLTAHSIEAIATGSRLGATGCISIPWLTADRRVVLSASDAVRRRRRRMKIANMNRPELPELAELDELLELGVGIGAIVLDVNNQELAHAVIDVAKSASSQERLWLRAPLEVVELWSHDIDRSRVIDRARRGDLQEGAERRAARLRQIGLRGLSMPRTDWTGGLIATLHRFGCEAWATDAPHVRMIHELLDMGIDAVASTHPERLADAAAHRS